MKDTIANYRVVQKGEAWAVEHDGQMEGDYATKEAAFEAIIWAASLSIMDGIGVQIDVPSRISNEESLESR